MTTTTGYDRAPPLLMPPPRSTVAALAKAASAACTAAATAEAVALGPSPRRRRASAAAVGAVPRCRSAAAAADAHLAVATGRPWAHDPRLWPRQEPPWPVEQPFIAVALARRRSLPLASFAPPLSLAPIVSVRALACEVHRARLLGPGLVRSYIEV
eukprot:CAMPEP_0174695390 /NCGR_PEP_ID=MMETSP1094-20130205/1766_1 /TAXON_ID=156173 /ORGANISM="Chrysochromulina brevifilum, Strain UTEX LB 985" /LENGTH=155 /DNA_ID=CAMNT_0015891867 /DNA_START=134 /DNA_END=602 /DNA_ORIENTATION=+